MRYKIKDCQREHRNERGIMRVCDGERQREREKERVYVAAASAVDAATDVAIATFVAMFADGMVDEQN